MIQEATNLDSRLVAFSIDIGHLERAIGHLSCLKILCVRMEKKVALLVAYFMMHDFRRESCIT